MRFAVAMFVVGCGLPAFAQDGKPAVTKVTGVVVYQTTALVTREVTLPEAAGVAEVVVTPLPASTLSTSLYAEAVEGVRVLSTRYRSRAIFEDTREEVRKLEAKIKEATKKNQQLQADAKALEQNLLFLAKLEGFTAATMLTLTEKGVLDAEKTITLTNYIKENRSKLVKEEITLKQQLEAGQEEVAFTQRLLQEKSGGGSRTERDAVILVDKTKAGPATLRLNYLVSAAAWKPQYRLRAGAKDGDKVTVEYQAAVSQLTGEDWGNVDVVLSTAQPLLNAAPPDLRTLEVSLGAGPGGQVALSGGRGGQAAGGPGGGAGGMMPTQSAVLQSLGEQSKNLRRQSNENYMNQKADAGGKDVNDAAAIDQFRDLLLSREELGKEPGFGGFGEGPTVTYHLKARMSLSSRADEQVIEIAKLDVAPKFYYKAVPVLTSHVYRIADMTNTTEYVLLPGEATMYLGTDFVGQTRLPLVAVGRPFTVGFGVDPQLQVQRKLMDKTRSTQGGNQVLNFKYRILLSSYKAAPVDVQMWDRLPHAEAQQTIAVTLTPTKLPLSDDPLYVRDDKPRNLLRWDTKVDNKQNGEKALQLDYEFKLELDRTVNIGAFLAK